MKQSDDIANLFQQFGGKADPYQELARKQEQQRSSERWPLVSAIRGALGGDVPAVDRRPEGLAAPAQQNPAAPVASEPAPAGWTRPAAQRVGDSPAPMWGAAPTPAPAPAMALAAAPRVPSASAPALAVRSPLAGLAGLHASAATTLRDASVVPPAPLPTDLPSVFARLAGSPQPQPTATWQPRKGQS